MITHLVAKSVLRSKIFWHTDKSSLWFNQLLPLSFQEGGSREGGMYPDCWTMVGWCGRWEMMAREDAKLGTCEIPLFSFKGGGGYRLLGWWVGGILVMVGWCLAAGGRWWQEKMPPSNYQLRNPPARTISNIEELHVCSCIGLSCRYWHFGDERGTRGTCVDYVIFRLDLVCLNEAFLGIQFHQSL